MPAEASVQLEKLLENNNELTAEITSILYFVSAMAGGLFMHEGAIVEDWLDGVQKLTRGSEETATGIAAFGSGMAFSDHLFGALEAAIRTYTNNNNRGRWAYTFDAFWGDDQHNNASIHMYSKHRDHAGNQGDPGSNMHWFNENPIYIAHFRNNHFAKTTTEGVCNGATTAHISGGVNKTLNTPMPFTASGWIDLVDELRVAAVDWILSLIHI